MMKPVEVEAEFESAVETGAAWEEVEAGMHPVRIRMSAMSRENISSHVGFLS